MKWSQWELLRGTCANSPAKSIFNSPMATNDKKNWWWKKAHKAAPAKWSIFSKILQIQRRKQLKTKEKKRVLLSLFSPKLNFPCDWIAGWDPEPRAGKACLGNRSGPRACLFGDVPMGTRSPSLTDQSLSHTTANWTWRWRSKALDALLTSVFTARVCFQVPETEGGKTSPEGKRPHWGMLK